MKLDGGYLPSMVEVGWRSHHEENMPGKQHNHEQDTNMDDEVAGSKPAFFSASPPLDEKPPTRKRSVRCTMCFFNLCNGDGISNSLFACLSITLKDYNLGTI